MTWKILYFDDQVSNIECLREVLVDKFQIIGSSDSTQLESLLALQPHAILLDVHMPIVNGHELYRMIVTHPLYNGCPIFFISCGQSDELKMKSYHQGAADFIQRSLGIDEISARISNKIKIYLERSMNVSLGKLHIDLNQIKATLNGVTLDLTLAEMRILNNLVRCHPESFSKQHLIEKIWGGDMKVATLNTHLSNLKAKIKDWEYMIKSKDDNLLIIRKD